MPLFFRRSRLNDTTYSTAINIQCMYILCVPQHAKKKKVQLQIPRTLEKHFTSPLNKVALWVCCNCCNAMVFFRGNLIFSVLYMFVCNTHLAVSHMQFVAILRWDLKYEVHPAMAMLSGCYVTESV